MKYIITKIIEPDFGCEGLPEDAERMDRVFLRGEDGSEHIAVVADELLYRLNLDVGSETSGEELGAALFPIDKKADL